MDKNFLIQLTNSIYRLTLFFPKKEPLRYKMRELADDILSNPSKEKLEILDSFFEVAKAQNWVGPADLLAIKEEYDKLKGSLSKEKMEELIAREKPRVANLALQDRQERILIMLREKGRAQVWEIKELFPDTSKRTIRRDVEQMFNQGIIERIGERNDTFYQLRREA